MSEATNIPQFRGPPSALEVSAATALRVKQARATYNRGYADGYRAGEGGLPLWMAWLSGVGIGVAVLLLWQAMR